MVIGERANFRGEHCQSRLRRPAGKAYQTRFVNPQPMHPVSHHHSLRMLDANGHIQFSAEGPIRSRHGYIFDCDCV